MIPEGVGEELMPLKAIACWSTLEEALNRYIGKGKWSYDVNGLPQADGFNIYVNMGTGYCHVQGDDVDYYFYFG